MWVTTPTTQSFLPIPISFVPFWKLRQSPTTTVSTLHLRRRNPHPPLIIAFASSQDTGGLGQSVLNALESGPTSGSTPSKKPQPNKGTEISGSDILRALQKASARKANIKNKNKNKKKESSEFKRKNINNKNIGAKVVDFEKVRPITVKSDWATRLTELEKRLQEFSLL